MNIDKNNKTLINELVTALGLEPHVEGGYFRQTFKSKNLVNHNRRSILTSIYYLLTCGSTVGHFHKNKSDIMHYFQHGDAITYYLIYPDGKLETKVLGSDFKNGEQLQFVVSSGVWKASSLNTNGEHGYGLIGEAVAPGFEYEDMELATKTDLLKVFPQHKAVIERFCKS